MVVAALFLLAACAGSKDDPDAVAKKEETKKEEAKKEAAEKEKPMPICPQVAILRDIDVIKDYGLEKPDPAQLVAEAKMLGIDGDCEYKKDGIDIAFTLNMIAGRGPRLGGLHASFPFFVAVVDPDENILNKENLTVAFGFSSDSQTANHAEALHVFIPLPKAKWENGPDYRVLAGFQVASPAKENSR